MYLVLILHFYDMVFNMQWLCTITRAIYNLLLCQFVTEMIVLFYDEISGGSVKGVVLVMHTLRFQTGTILTYIMFRIRLC